MNNKGKGSPWPIVVVAVAALILFYPQLQGLLGGAPVTPPPAEPEAGFICPVDTTALGFTAVDQDDPGTEVSTTVRYWVEGLPQGTVNTSATGPTVSPGDEVQVWFGAGDATYYGSLFSNGDVPCKGTYEIAGRLHTKDTGVTMTVFDEFENPQDGATNNQTLGIGETVEMKMRVKGNHEKYYGNPEVSMNNALTVEYRSTEIDTIEVTQDGAELSSAGVPVAELVSNVNNREIAFEMPKIAGSGNVEYFLIIKADDINNPSEDITLKIYDADYFYNSETGNIGTGWEDESDSDIGITTEPTATVYLS